MSTHKIVVRLGLTGSGKTLDQTEEDVLPHILAGTEVWISYFVNLDLPNIHYFSRFEEIKDLRNAVIVFDEVTDFFDPREWEKEGSETRRWFRLHRHRHLTIICNTQDVSLVAKTIGTLAHEWIYCKEAPKSAVWEWIRKVFGAPPRVSVAVANMSYQELKKMAAGWEIGEKLEELGEWKTIRYPIPSIIHEELNEYKIELVHRYCPDCEQRAGEQIKKEETWDIIKSDATGKDLSLKQIEYCPTHKNTLLEIRKSGIYDTDYEPKIEDVKGEWRYYVPSPEGMMWIQYKGNPGTENTKRKPKLPAFNTSAPSGW